METKEPTRKTHYRIMKMSNASDGSREAREPLVDKHVAESQHEQPWMVYLSTFVAVCGSFAFGSCVSIHCKITRMPLSDECYVVILKNGF